MIQISCAENPNKTFLATEGNNFQITNIPERIINETKIEPREMEKMIIYWSSLVRIWADDEHGKVLSSQKGDLAYRIEAVSPQSIEQIENNQDIPQSLIKHFKAANQKTGRLEASYPVKYPISGFSGSRDLAKFYKEVKRKNSQIAAVVCFSNIGIDDSYTETLVYAEYYRPDRGLVKFYFQMKMDLLQEKIDGDSFSGVENYKMIQVN